MYFRFVDDVIFAHNGRMARRMYSQSAIEHDDITAEMLTKYFQRPETFSVSCAPREKSVVYNCLVLYSVFSVTAFKSAKKRAFWSSVVSTVRSAQLSTNNTHIIVNL